MEELKFEYEKSHGKEGQSITTRGKQKKLLERSGSRHSNRVEKQNGEVTKSVEVVLQQNFSMRRHHSHQKAEHGKLDGQTTKSDKESLQRRDGHLMSRHATS